MLTTIEAMDSRQLNHLESMAYRRLSAAILQSAWLWFGKDKNNVLGILPACKEAWNW